MYNRVSSNLDRRTLTMGTAVMIAGIIWALVAIPIFLLVDGVWAWVLAILVLVVFIGAGLAWRPVVSKKVKEWADLNKGLTYVEEGTAKFVMLGGEPVATLIQMQGYRFDLDGNVVAGTAPRQYPVLFGAWWFENPLVQRKTIFGYDWRRTVVDEHGKTRELNSSGDNAIDYVPLQRDVYWAKITGAETKDLIPVDVELLITAQIVNPYKAIFQTGAKPGVWLQVVIASMEGEVTPVMSEEPYADWITKPNSVGDKLFEKLQKYGVIKEFEDLHGVRVFSIRGLKVDPHPDYRELTTRGTKARLEGAAAVIEAELKGDAQVALATRQADALLKRVRGIEAAGGPAMALEYLDALRVSPVGANIMMMMPDVWQKLLDAAKGGTATP